MRHNLISRNRVVAATVVVALLAVVVVVGAAFINARATGPAQARLEEAARVRGIGATEQTIADLKERADAAPDDTSTHTQLGMAYVQLARETGDPANYARAEDAFDRALARDPTDVDAIIGLGSLALSRHEFDLALRLGEQARSLNDTVPRVYGLIGDAQVELGDYDGAVVTIQTMVDMRPDLASYSRVAYLRELHGDLEGAIDAMQRAVEAGGGNIENTEFVRVQLGNLYFTAGDLIAAERAYAESLAHLRDYPFALAGMARVRAAEGDLDMAVELYRRAASRVPIMEIVIGFGEALEAAGRSTEADEQYALVMAMGQLLEANGVRSDLEMAGFLAEHGPDPAAAVDMARAALAARPTVFAADTLAWALHAAGDDEAAAPYAREALRLDTENSMLLYHAGVIAAANGETETAREHIARALDLNPAFSPLHAPRAEAALAALEAQE